ncbi:MAG: hypothetical protein AAGG51_15495 [Cyanobacteria bacterium P01_G01_bin.54]
MTIGQSAQAIKFSESIEQEKGIWDFLFGRRRTDRNRRDGFCAIAPSIQTNLGITNIQTSLGIDESEDEEKLQFNLIWTERPAFIWKVWQGTELDSRHKIVTVNEVTIYSAETQATVTRFSLNDDRRREAPQVRNYLQNDLKETGQWILQYLPYWDEQDPLEPGRNYIAQISYTITFPSSQPELTEQVKRTKVIPFRIMAAGDDRRKIAEQLGVIDILGLNLEQTVTQKFLYLTQEPQPDVFALSDFDWPENVPPLWADALYTIFSAYEGSSELQDRLWLSLRSNECGL